MQVPNPQHRTVGVHDFAMNPKNPVQRSSFPVNQPRKVPFSAGYLIPIYCEEVLPGDMFNVACHVAARTAVPLVPVFDNWTMDIHFFFVPNRLVWDNWERFMGAQDNPADSISYILPESTSGVNGYSVGTIHDYFGLPTAGQIGVGNTFSHQVLPLRGYNLIWNQWYRDENLQNSVSVPKTNGPDSPALYTLLKRGKRPGYFTSALPSPQKGAAVTLPLGTTAPVIPNGTTQPLFNTSAVVGRALVLVSGGSAVNYTGAAAGASANAYWNTTGLLTDLSTATAATVNQIRQAFQIQRLLERDARGGTRYTELIQNHFGVRPPDFRLQRPEFIGGGSIRVLTNAIPQTSATGLTGGSTPAGNLAATGFAEGRVGFTYASQEHGYIIGLASVRADITYSQGCRKHWKRSTRYDFAWPVFAGLGEQAILNQEIYAQGASPDGNVFGYIPRYDEYRHFPAEIVGILKPTAPGNIAYWHSSERFASLPTLGATFIEDPTNTVLQRNFAAGAATEGQQIIADILYSGRVARPLPMFGIPGGMDRF